MSTDQQTPKREVSDITLSSSRFGAAMGINPWRSRAKLWRLMTEREHPQSRTDRMAWGNNNEWRAVVEVEAHTGLVFDYTGDNQRSLANGWLTATPDGSCEYNGAKIGLEVKCPEHPSDEIREHYMAQIQGQCFVCGFDEVMFANWTHTSLHLWRVYRSAEYIRQMLLLLEDFREFLIMDTPPPRLGRRPQLPEVDTEKIA